MCNYAFTEGLSINQCIGVTQATISIGMLESDWILTGSAFKDVKRMGKNWKETKDQKKFLMPPINLLKTQIPFFKKYLKLHLSSFRWQLRCNLLTSMVYSSYSFQLVYTHGMYVYICNEAYSVVNWFLIFIWHVTTKYMVKTQPT